MSGPLIGAVEAGGTKFALAIARPDGTIVERARIPTITPEETFAAMAEFFRAGTARHGAIGGFGVATFGPVSLDRAAADWGCLASTPKPGWRGASFPAALAEFGAPLAIETDVNGAALGEWLAGAGRGAASIAYTTVGTGIGTGVLANGVPLAGIGHFEMGHVAVPHDSAGGFAGVCPFHGACLEGLASGPAIRARWGASLDRLGAAEVETVAGYLADFAAMLVLTHMPARLVFGGGVMKAPGLIEALRRRTGERLAGYVTNPALDPGLARYIVTPTLGDDAGITGAIELGRRALEADA